MSNQKNANESFLERKSGPIVQARIQNKNPIYFPGDGLDFDNENEAIDSIHALLNYDKSKGSKLDVLLGKPDKKSSQKWKGAQSHN